MLDLNGNSSVHLQTPKKALVLSITFLMIAAMIMPVAMAAEISTAKLIYYYPDDQTVDIVGSGFLGDSPISINITILEPDIHFTDTVTSNSDGRFVYTYPLDATPLTYVVEATDGTNTATTTFYDPPTQREVRFVETGLPDGISWTATIDSTTKSSTTPNLISFGGINYGTHTCSITSPITVAGVKYSASPLLTSIDVPVGTGPYEIDITFTASAYQVAFAVSPDASGNTNPSATAYYDDGAIIDPLTATAATGYTFSSWSVSTAIGTITIGNTALASTTATIHGTGTITANFVSAPSNQPPVSDADGPYTGYEGSPVSFDGSGSSDSDGTIVSYSWDFGDGSSLGTGVSPTHTYADNGVYTVTLTVTDDDGAMDIDTTTATIANVAPTVKAPLDTSGNEGSSISIGDFTFTDPGTLDTHTASIEWGDGVTQNLGTVTNPISGLSHTYDDNSVYTVKVTVTDKDGDSGSASMTVTVYNVAPAVSAGVDKTADEGSTVSFDSSSFTDPGVNDKPWTVEWDFGDGSTAVTSTVSSQGSLPTVSHVYADNKVGGYTVTLKVTDKDGDQGTDTLTVTVNNVAPTVDAGADKSVNEGSSLSVSGSFTDPGILDTHTAEWDWGDGTTSAGAVTESSGSGTVSGSHTYADGPNSYTVTLTVTDKDGGKGTDTFIVTVNNVAPDITSVTCPVDPVKIGTSITTSGAYTDPGILDTQTATWDWGDGATSSGVVTYATGSGGSGTVSGSHTYTMTGLFTVKLTVTDKDGGTDTWICDCYIVVYDPSAGFVTGGGWIMSPAGAYAADPLLTGKATFGFVSKYQKGANVPTGNTEFQFHAAGMNFKSTSYQWLVVAGSNKAMYKGFGTINGGGNYGFLLSIIDGGKTGVDKFRIKIWDIDNGNSIVYDNNMGAADNADAATAISGGSIQIQAK